MNNLKKNKNIFNNFAIRKLKLRYLTLIFGFLTILFYQYNNKVKYFIKYIDEITFYKLNSIIGKNHFFDIIIGYMNHKYENYTSIIIIIFYHFYSIYILSSKEKNKFVSLKNYIISFFIFIFTLEIGIFLKNLIFHKIFQIYRISPSLKLDSVIFMQDILQNPLIKDRSTDTFISGHAFVIMYWGLYHKKITKKWTKLTIILCLSVIVRLIVGSHWLTDILCGWFSALLYFEFIQFLLYFYTKINKKICYIK